MDYPAESFTESERDALRPHFTNLDRPVFGLVGFPETVKGALFARYSRYQGTLRRLYLDEFADAGRAGEPFDGEEGERARKLYERIFLGYGDDSVAQLGGAHIACEWVSNVMTKLLQRGRLAAYLEQSTRYIPYDTPIAGGSATATGATPRSAPSTTPRWTSCSTPTRSRCRGWRRGPPSASRAPPTSPRRPTGARCAPRRSTCCAGCCRPRRSRTWGSSPAARPTSSCCCACTPRRCPRRATTPT